MSRNFQRLQLSIDEGRKSDPFERIAARTNVMIDIMSEPDPEVGVCIWCGHAGTDRCIDGVSSMSCIRGLESKS